MSPAEHPTHAECAANHAALETRLNAMANSMEQALADLRAGAREFRGLAVQAAEQSGEHARLADAVLQLSTDVRKHLTSGNGAPPLPVRVAVLEERMGDMEADANKDAAARELKADRDERAAREVRWRAVAYEVIRMAAGFMAGGAGGYMAGG